jgi:hypothetical protein
VRTVDLRLELSDVTPRVWRVLRVPRDLRLDDLHHAIQAVMGWEDFHPHVFEVGDKEFGTPPDTHEEDDDNEFADPGRWAGDDHDITVANALAQSPAGFTYIYNFNEDWRVMVTLVDEASAAIASEPAVACLDGEHAGPQQESRELEPFSVAAADGRLRRALRPRATPEFPAGAHAHPDQQLLANLTLVVLLLGSHRTKSGSRQAWKHLRSDILDSLGEAGLIDTTQRQKSVNLTDAGIRHAERLLQRLRTL